MPVERSSKGETIGNKGDDRKIYSSGDCWLQLKKRVGDTSDCSLPNLPSSGSCSYVRALQVL